MYTLIYMKADYEPWWKFEGWEQYIVSVEHFQTKEHCDAILHCKLNELRQHFPYEKQKEDCYWAFWSEEEQIYCEGCNEEQQIFHGIMLISP